MKQQIVVATMNAGKMRELAAMLDLDIQFRGLAEFEGIEEVVEDGHTFAENARKKAIGYSEQTGLWTIADDSGLVVDALGGRPGVMSARFSGAKCDDNRMLDRRNMAKVLKLMEEVPDEQRTARFKCCICLASGRQILAETEGTLEGLIARQERGSNGFGYDPIFYVPGLDRTVAELGADEKNEISHRGNAIRRLKPLLAALIGQ
jgi:XTP/dITP diphosphohydrolase